METLQLKSGNEDLETTRHQFEIDELSTAGFGKFQHLVAIQRAIDDHDHVRSRRTKDRAQTFVGTKNRNVRRRLHVT
jgi:hypothetical protein